MSTSEQAQIEGNFNLDSFLFSVLFNALIYTRISLRGSYASGSEVKNPPANAGDTGDAGLIPGVLEEEMATHSSILAWKSPWTGDPGGLKSMGSQRVGHTD